jgi:arylsulfatase A-like enzyme
LSLWTPTSLRRRCGASLPSKGLPLVVAAHDHSKAKPWQRLAKLPLPDYRLAHPWTVMRQSILGDRQAKHEPPNTWENEGTPAMSRLLPLLLLLMPANFLQAATPPNVIIIFIDDMGYGDVGFNGATGPKTPHLNRMAEEGMQFTDFYVGCAVCSGSRTALLTGAHYQRLNMKAVLFPHSDTGLHPDETTIAEMLREIGYKTACVGKWHLGHLPPCLPTMQGFDSYYGIPYSNDMWIDPANQLADEIVLRETVTLQELRAGHKRMNWVPLMRDEEIIEYPADQSTLTKRYTEEAVRFIEANKEGPFFLYLPHTMVHLPLAVSPAFAGRTGRLIWDAIEEVDWSVGQILEAVTTANIDKQTLVIFTSDNGAAVGSSLPLRSRKGSVYDGGIREPTVMRWPGQIPAGSICREVTASVDILPTLAHLAGAKLPERKIDGKNIWPLMYGEVGAKSPHAEYCLMHGPGTVRSGKWKYYPWREGKHHEDRPRKAGPLSSDSVQLYDTSADIGETTNLASHYPEVVKRLQAAYDGHVDEIKSNRRKPAKLLRPPGSLSPARPR